MTCQFMLEAHAVRHSYDHLASICLAVGRSDMVRERDDLCWESGRGCVKIGFSQGRYGIVI